MRLLRIVPDDTKFDFMRFRRISFPISAILSIVAISLYFFHGLNFGIDFKGGTLMEVRAKAGNADIAGMRETLSKLGLGVLIVILTVVSVLGILPSLRIVPDDTHFDFTQFRRISFPISAIDAGFKRALATILDSNITTFIAAAVLFYIGTGPVRGFAVTLGIGILTSLFTAFTLTRLIVAYWVRMWRPRTVPI